MAAAEAIIIESPDRNAIADEYAPLVLRARAIKVTDRAGHESAQKALQGLKQAERKVRERLDPIISDAHKAHRGLTALRNDLLAPITQAVGVVNGECDRYEAVQRRLAEEKRRAEEEKARQAEEERRLMEAIEAEEDGDTAEAEALLEEPVETPVVHVEPETAKVQGVTARVRWKAEVVDLVALIKHVAEHPEWQHLLTPAMPALNGLARSQRDALNLPGVKAVAVRERAISA